MNGWKDEKSRWIVGWMEEYKKFKQMDGRKEG